MTGEPPHIAPTGQECPTRHIVVMGVAGAGKTTVARHISEVTGLTFGEADEFHPEANVARMRAGIPLDDAARWPWLQALAAWMADRHRDGVSTVLACSALRRSYRDLLRQGPPSVQFVHLDGPTEVIRERMSTRAGHYMPVSLLDSQIATLEPLGPDEDGMVLDLRLPAGQLAISVADRLGPPARPGSVMTGESRPSDGLPR
ncbi:gluconokinase [Micromonospora echinospora]|uniref:gluconokinase n=1 Tax=Micromonospora echinospora TaxID=1877 RepID=UPI003A8C647C